jgi:hypothetical protein
LAFELEERGYAWLEAEARSGTASTPGTVTP